MVEEAEAGREQRVFWEIPVAEQLFLAMGVVHAVVESLAWFSWTNSTRLTMVWTQVAAEVCED